MPPMNVKIGLSHFVGDIDKHVRFHIAWKGLARKRVSSVNTDSWDSRRGRTGCRLKQSRTPDDLNDVDFPKDFPF